MIFLDYIYSKWEKKTISTLGQTETDTLYYDHKTCGLNSSEHFIIWEEGRAIW